VSLLTPVYNGEEYLEECIQSVLRQTYSNWEYVIVDNLSVDRTPEIADRYARLDSRVTVIHASEFVDMWANHNRAISAMDPASRYCKFVQADDWIYPECVERMVDVAEQNPSAGIVGAYALNVNRVQLDGLFSYSQTMIEGHEALRRLVLGSWMDWVVGGPTSVLLRSDCTRDLPDFFDRRVFHADADASFRVLLSADFGFVHQVLTFMRGDNPRGTTSYAQRVYSFFPTEGRMLIRYGPKVMPLKEYRGAMRRWLRRYGRWLTHQALRPRRRAQQEFHDFHRNEIDWMIVDTKHDLETRLVLECFRRLLLPRCVKGAAAS
jgi:glycosyltransferase involved in cell wall biosynthesis